MNYQPHYPNTPSATLSTYPVPRRKRWPLVVGLSVAAVMVVCGLGSLLALNSAFNKTATLGSTATYGPAPSSKGGAGLASKSQIFTAGDYEVKPKSNVEAGAIAPGTYTIRTSTSCYWARLKGFSGELNDVIANGNLGGDQAVRVTVKKTDKGLSLEGDCQLR